MATGGLLHKRGQIGTVAPNGMKAVALVSHDQGGSWPDYVQVFDSNNGATIHFEQSVTQMADGRLLAVAWAYDRATRKTLPTPYTISENGRSFAAPRIGGINGKRLNCCP